MTTGDDIEWWGADHAVDYGIHGGDYKNNGCQNTGKTGDIFMVIYHHTFHFMTKH